MTKQGNHLCTKQIPRSARAGSRLPCVGGAQPGEGSRGSPRLLVGPGQSPGRGVQGAKP